MHTETLTVENIKCGGCAGQIERKLSQLEGVASVTVNVEAGQVSVEADNLETVQAELARLGYPVAGTVSGVSALGAKAKSFVSCAIGKTGTRESD
jgi:copper chaperone